MAFIGQTIRAFSPPDLVIPNVTCDASVQVGDWVRMNEFEVAIKAIADTVDNSNVLGLVESKSGSTLCNVRVLGVSEPIFSGLDVTKEYMLSSTTPGGQTITAPSNSGNVVLKIGQPYSPTKMLVLKGTRMVRS